MLARSFRSVAAVTLISLMAACVSSGTKISDEQINQLEKGKTTYSDVVAKFGTPTSTSTTSEGIRVAVYAYTEAHANAASYVPVVGLFAGGATGNSSGLTMTFDKAGVLQTYSTSNSAIQTHTGIGG